MARRPEDRVVSLGYQILVERSVRKPLQKFIRDRGTRYIVLTDASMEKRARELTRGAPGSLGVIAVPLGERRKTFATVERMLENLVAHDAGRDTLIVGVGGGVAADLFGFTASVYMRGVPYAHVATSLVAMVDAAVGGKTAVDIASGKNLAGTFSDPVAVFADVQSLATLSERELRNGLAEVVKHAVIAGDPLFNRLERLAALSFSRWPWETLLAQAIKVKTQIVALDRDEQGVREVLNLGHTFGHAIERASGFSVPHGAAVSIGLRAAGLLALETQRFSATEQQRLIALMKSLGLPLRTAQTPPKVFSAMSADKKKKRGRLRFVLPRKLGDIEYGVEVPSVAVKHVLRLIARPPGEVEFR